MHVKGEEKWIDKIGLIVDWIRAIYMLNQNKLIMGESQELYITGCIYSIIHSPKIKITGRIGYLNISITGLALDLN
jgi:hypothetical protein